MTKADRIRGLAKHGDFYSTSEIAEIVAKEFGSCSPEYVRVCARQRANGPSIADARHNEKYIKQYGVTPDDHRYRTNAVCRANSIESAKRWRKENRERYNAYHRAYNAQKKLERKTQAQHFVDRTSASPDAGGA